jgi:gas vesicle protein
MSLVFLCGSLLGAAVGVAVGILFAPAKGSYTRRRIARTAEELGDRASVLTESARETAKEAIERGRRFVA